MSVLEKYGQPLSTIISYPGDRQVRRLVQRRGDRPG